MKIEKLTPEQEVELPRFRQRYLDMACNGSRTDRDELERTLTDAYAVIGKPAPRLLIFDSPAACMLAIKIFKLPPEKILGDQLRDQLWDQLGGQLWDQLGGQLRGQLWDQLGGQLWDQLRDQLWGQLWDQLGGQLRDQLGGQLWDQLWDQLRDQLWGQRISDPHFLWGSQDLYWIAWGRFAQQIGVKLKPETDKRLGIMERISAQCEWWWPYENIVVASQKPTVVRWDDQRRLHGEGRAAVEYADGYSLHAWHGVTIPPDWSNGKPPSAAEALNWPNTEQRRAACEIIGWVKILDQLDGKMIDRHANPQVGELWEANLPDHGRERFLKVACGTGRTFVLPVGMEYATAREANAATYGIAPQLLDNIQFRT